MVKVKICGITNLEDALLASSAGADAVGFIFSTKSPRYLNPQAAKKIIDKLDPFLVKAGVFLNQDKEAVCSIAEELSLDVLQFHGEEPPAYCHFFRPKFKVIKVFFPQDRPYADKIRHYRVDAFMFDIKYAQKIAGEKFLPLGALKEIRTLIKAQKRIIISGGLNTKNISRIKKLNPYAVDVSSGVEKLVGRKDEQLLKEFINKVKE